MLLHIMLPPITLYGLLRRPLKGEMASTPLAVLSTTQHKPTSVRQASHLVNLDRPENEFSDHVHMIRDMILMAVVVLGALTHN